jgi:hypothetical protein
MPVGQSPAEGAVILFDGEDIDKWVTRAGEPSGWTVKDGILVVDPGSGDIMTKEQFADFFLHVEFRCPDMPEATGQAKANSGVYLQGRYEIQVLDSDGWEVPGLGDCGAIYNVHAPLVNACKPALAWQCYDVAFRTARVKKGQVEEPARVTVLHNDRVIQNNVVLPGATGGALDEDVTSPGPLLLQDHGNLMAFRNIWAVHLPQQGSEDYKPR